MTGDRDPLRPVGGDGSSRGGRSSSGPSWESILEKVAGVSGIPAGELVESFRQTGGVLEPARELVGTPRGASRGVERSERASSPPARAERRGGKGARRTRRARMSKRRARHEARSQRLRARWFGAQPPTMERPADVPELKPEARARAERVAFDPSGRMALEALVRVLPWGQAEKLCGAALAAVPFVRTRRTSRIERADLNAATFPAHDRDGALAAAAAEVAEVAGSGWYRRLVASAVGHWTLARRLSQKERQASRGGVYVVEGFCQGALSWLVPRVEEASTWSRSAIWRPNGPFLLLGECPRRPGREPGVSGLGLFVRWQPPVHVARYKGPVKTRRTASGAEVTEQHALAVSRYDAAMCGRTAWSAAQRGHPEARAFCKALCPWLFDADDGAESEPVELTPPVGATPVEAEGVAPPQEPPPGSGAPERPP